MERIFLGVLLLAIAAGGQPVAAASAQPYDWTGFYLGGQIGAQWLASKSSFNLTVPPGTGFPGFPGATFTGSKTFHDTSLMGGGQLGFNWQPAGMPLVAGIESDLTGANHNKSEELSRVTIADHTDGRSELNLQGSIRGRLGWAINRVLLYATSGVGFGAGRATTIATRDNVASASFGRSDTLVGWTVGAGIEYALPFSSHWLIRAEYRYADLGSTNLSFPGDTTGGVSFLPYTAKADFRTHDAIFGVNFKF